MLSTLRALAEWLAGTELSNTIQNVSWIIPTVQTVHIVCVAIVVSATFLVSLRVLGVFYSSQPIAALSSRFLPLCPSRISLPIRASCTAVSAPSFCLIAD